jgi:hypothetical protein
MDRRTFCRPLRGINDSTTVLPCLGRPMQVLGLAIPTHDDCMLAALRKSQKDIRRACNKNTQSSEGGRDL